MANSKQIAMDSMGQACREAGLIQSNHLNRPRLQRGSAPGFGNGRPSRSGGIYGAERGVGANHINQNGREWESTGVVRSSNRSQVTGRRGGLAQSNGNPGNSYSGGPTNRRG